MVASINDHEKVVREFLNSPKVTPEIINHENEYGQTALCFAKAQEIKDLLIAHGAK
jgi:ankyrin repeat protein